MNKDLQVIQLDDIVKLSKKSKEFKKWGKFTFRVIDCNYKNTEQVRIVRNMRNDKLGSTNHYILELKSNTIIHKKNKRYLIDLEESELLDNIDF